MHPLVSLSLVILGLSVSLAQETTSFLEAFPHASIRALEKIPVHRLNDNSSYVAPPLFDFVCPAVPTPEPTTSIYSLKPGHIKVVMAMGDSITAAMSAKDSNILSLKEYRGISYAIGGDAGVLTMPNLLKQFTEAGYPIGASTGIGKRTSADTGLNAAESGDINQDMLEQAQWLVGQLKANTKINLAEDWKVLSIWIGSNNLCDVCNNNVNNNADTFESNIIQALDYLRANVPRLFVNLVANLDITQIYSIKDGMCGMLHPVECACAADSDVKVREATKVINLEYQKRAVTIAQHYASLNDNQFAAVVQPFLTQSVVSSRSYLSAADCFHPSAIAHQYAAVALWNAMITPSAEKKTSWDPKEEPICPGESTLVYTN